MSESVQDLARRAVACRAWRWVPGMVVVSEWPDCVPSDALRGPARLVRVVKHGDCTEYEWAWTWKNGDGGRMPADALPDITDPLTVLALLLLVREAWRDEGIAVRGVWEGPGLRHWHVEAGGAHGAEFAQLDGAHSSEAAALVAALEAAPVQS